MLQLAAERAAGAHPYFVTPEHTASPLAALRDGALDLAVVYHRTADKRIRFEPLFDEARAVVT